MFSIDSSGFRKWFAGAGKALPTETSAALKLTARIAAKFARSSRLYENHTYRLQKSIRGELTSPTESRTIAGARHAYWVENGNAPLGGGRIYPKRAKFLRFFWKGSWHFARSVNPAKPRPFMREARDQVIPVFERLAAHAVDTSFR